jgi:rhodanese-related sulfurtransferase
VNKKVILWVAVAVLVVAGILALTTAPPAVNKNIGNEELVSLQAAGASVVDVRTTQEFDSGRIPLALNVPLDTLAQVSATWNKDKPVVVYCATGARSLEAAEYLAGAGFRAVYNLEKGISAWTGELEDPNSAATPPAAAGAIATNGKPLFIDFSGST